MTPADVVEAARTGDPASKEAVRLFARLLGRFAGDLCLVYGAVSVYIAGGIAPRILDVLAAGGFRAAFERKAPFEAEMRDVATYVITHPEPALAGLEAIAKGSRPFVFEAHGWNATP
jgi:glucokinase